jgi:hypothetical protein
MIWVDPITRRTQLNTYPVCPNHSHSHLYMCTRVLTVPDTPKLVYARVRARTMM